MGWQASTGQIPLPTVPPTPAVVPMLGKGRLRQSGNTGEGRLGQLTMMAAASPSWRTGARLPGPASDSAPGSASGSSAPSVA